MERNTSETVREMAQETEVPQRAERRLPLDAANFAEIHRQYRDRLVRSITGFVNDQGKAEDIAADAFQAAWKKRETFRGEALPYTWIQAIARNGARDALRRERMAQFESIDQDGTREFAAPDRVADELERQDDQFRLKTALEQLPARHRRALIAHFIDGLSVREIARRERVPVGTVLSRVFTAKQLLRHVWESNVPQGNVMVRETISPKPEERQIPQAREAWGQERATAEPPEPETWGR